MNTWNYTFSSGKHKKQNKQVTDKLAKTRINEFIDQKSQHDC